MDLLLWSIPQVHLRLQHELPSGNQEKADRTGFDIQAIRQGGEEDYNSVHSIPHHDIYFLLARVRQVSSMPDERIFSRYRRSATAEQPLWR